MAMLSFPLLVILAIIALIPIALIVVLIVVLVRSGKKKKQPQYGQQPMPGFYPEQQPVQGFYPGQDQGFYPGQQPVPGAFPGQDQGFNPVQQPASDAYPGQAQAYDQNNQPQQTVPEMPQTLSILGSGGEFDGQKFKLEGDLFLGRQPSRCLVCYPRDAAGISGLHCQVRMEGDSVELTDLGSSFGTFFNGEKLTPNTPVLLNPGDSFWLADPLNTFIVVK